MSLIDCIKIELPLFLALYFLGILILAFYNSKFDQKTGFLLSLWRVLTGWNSGKYLYYFVEKVFLVAFCFVIIVSRAENCAF